MSSADLRYVSTAVRELDADVLLFAVTKGEEGPALHDPDSLLGELGHRLGSFGVTGAKDELVRIPAVPGLKAGSIALLGLGDAPITAAALRSAAGTAARRIHSVDSLAFALPLDGPDAAAAIAEGALLGLYRYTAQRAKTLDKQKPAAGAVLVAGGLDTQAVEAGLERARTVARHAALLKDLVNTPPQELSPEVLADRAADEATAAGLEVRIWDVPALEADAFGGILAVGKGSSRPPRLVRIDYSPAQASRHVALVGKGITYDTGGLSLKPAASMVGMHYDMTGAATVLATVLAAARLELPVRVTAWLCIAENMPSGTALRPNDVITIHGGRTVEVLNTDAEGRLVLADGLDAASAEHPDAIIDVATLTGAATIALGTRTVGVMGEDALVAEVIAAGEACGEPYWQMPMPEDLRPLLDSEVADLANARPGNPAGGMLVAAHFLKEFVGRTADNARQIPWAHLDIANAGFNKGSGRDFTAPGPTAVAFRALLGLLESSPKQSKV